MHTMKLRWVDQLFLPGKRKKETNWLEKNVEYVE